MRIQKMNNNKMEIIIDKKDLKGKNLTIEDFMTFPSNKNSFLLDIVRFASKKLGFDLTNGKIIIDSFSIPCLSTLILIVTLAPYRAYKKTYKKYKINTSFLIKFKDFNTLCAFCSILDFDINSDLFYYNNFYYLNLSIKHICDCKKILLYLEEFTNDYKNPCFINENANLIIKKNAVNICRNLFVV